MWYYFLSAIVLGKLNGFFGIIDETAALVKNGYGLYQWWYTPSKTLMIEDKRPIHILELQNSGTQTQLNESGELDYDFEDSEDDISSPEVLLFEQPYRRFSQ